MFGLFVCLFVWGFEYTQHQGPLKLHTVCLGFVFGFDYALGPLSQNTVRHPSMQGVYRVAGPSNMQKHACLVGLVRLGRYLYARNQGP